MKIADKEALRRLGAGESIANVCTAAGLTHADFDAWWKRQAQARVPSMTGTRRAKLSRPVRIERDKHGIPHIHAANDADLFFGLGYAMAQDRLFQLDLLRRRGAGRLAEVLGPDGNTLDILTRTTG